MNSAHVALLDPVMFRPAAAPARTAPPAPDTYQTVIEPPRGWQWLNVRELWRHRELLFFLVWRNVKVRYKQTVLGAAWAVLQPALMMVVFTSSSAAWRDVVRRPALSALRLRRPLALVVLRHRGHQRRQQRRRLRAADHQDLLPPAGDSVRRGRRRGRRLHDRSRAPRWADGRLRRDPDLESLVAPLVFAIVALAAIGLGTLLAALNVAYRDFRYIIPFLIQVGMFATPTIYIQPTGNETAGTALAA